MHKQPQKANFNEMMELQYCGHDYKELSYSSTVVMITRSCLTQVLWPWLQGVVLLKYCGHDYKELSYSSTVAMITRSRLTQALWPWLLWVVLLKYCGHDY